MTQILHVNSSPRSEHSQSLTLANSFLAAFQKHNPDAEIDTLNLFEETLPPFGTTAAEAKMAAFAGQEQTPEQLEAWAQARAVFDRFAAADAYVFNVPMWNHGVPYILKQWIDIITQPGWVFGFDPAAGYTGLITGKKALVVYTSGVYTRGRPLDFGVDFQSTYFNDWLRFIGISDVTEIQLFGQVVDPGTEQSAAAAKARVEDLAAEF